MKVYLDFDGTCVEHRYPQIGRCNFGCIEVIDKLQKAGHEVVLNTMRCEFNDGSLQQALRWFENGWMNLLEDNVDLDLMSIKATDRKHSPAYWDWEFFKANDKIIIDDQSRGVPLKREVIGDGWMVDWAEVDRQFKEQGIY